MLAGTPSIPTMFSHFQSLASGDFGRPDSPVLKLAVPGRTRSVDSLNTLLRDLKHLDLSKHVVVGRPRASGGYADVYEGIFIVQGTNESVKVAIKRFRVFIHEDAGKDLAKSISREIRVWAKLSHMNILPFWGFKIADDRPSLVSQWMENGNLKSYMKDHPNMDVAETAKGIADGLTYLHTCGVIHADLRCDNILVHADERPMLTDFGISRILVESKTFTGTDSLKGNVRWMAIELLDWRLHSSKPEHQFHTKATDVWAFGMVLYELLARNVPFHNLKQEPVVVMAIIMGERPTLDGAQWDEDAEWLWSLCEECWCKDPDGRPLMSDLLNQLRTTVMPLRLTPLKNFIAHRDWIVSIAFSPDSQYLATASTDSSVCIWKLSDVPKARQPSHAVKLHHPDWVYSVAWCPTGRYVLTGAQDNIVRKWNTSDWELSLAPVAVHTAGVWAVAFSPDGQLYASGGADNTVIIWDSSTGAVKFGPLLGHNNWVRALSFSPNGSKIVSCSSDTSICIWDLDPNQGKMCCKRVVAHHDWVSSVSFHYGGDYFVTGSKDGSMRMWDARTGERILSKDGFYVHHDEVKSVQYSPNGQVILTASKDSSMRLLDASDGSFLTKRVVGHSGSIRDAKFSPDGRVIVSAGEDRKIIIWTVIADSSKWVPRNATLED